MSTDATAPGNNQRKIDLALKGANDRYQRLVMRIRRAEECAECRCKRTVVVSLRDHRRSQVAFCAACLSDMLCALCNVIHRRNR